MKNWFKTILLSLLVVGLLIPSFTFTATASKNKSLLLRAEGTAGVYLIENGFKRPIRSAEIFKANGFKWKDVIVIDQKEIDSYPLGSDVIIPIIKINVSKLNVRNIPGFSGQIIGSVSKEEIYNVLEESVNGWYKIQLNNGIQGWVISKYTIKIQKEPLVAPICTSWTYSDWSACSPNEEQFRTIISSEPSGCIGGNPVLRRSCIYVPETNKTLTVTKIIDGDTIVIENGDHVRLLGIDADEPNHPCYYEAKNRLESLILGKMVVLEKNQTDKDQYGRLLRYVFLNNRNINLQLIEEGLAICRFYDPDTKYKSECVVLEQQSKNNKTGCKWQEAQEATKPSIPKFERLIPEKTGLEVVQAESAKDYYGEQKIIEGKTFTKRYSNPALFINFCKPYPNHCFTSIIWNSDWYKFPENAASLYHAKTVRVKGFIQEYRGKPEIILKDPSQIEIAQ